MFQWKRLLYGSALYIQGWGSLNFHILLILYSTPDNDRAGPMKGQPIRSVRSSWLKADSPLSTVPLTHPYPARRMTRPISVCDLLHIIE